METKKKRKGEIEKPVYNKRLAYAVVAIVIMLVLTFSYFFLFRQSQPIEPKAAIIDQLGSKRLPFDIRHENETFVENATTLLYQRFSTVDYYSDNATVENYRNLASLNYKLIIWRAHSALDETLKYIAISSSEVVGSKNYDQYLENGQLTICNITGKYYYGITPKFVSECISGRFEDTVIILMSCNGLKEGYTKTAEAFVEKGVKAFISWDGWIDPEYNDNAIALLLDYLINKDYVISDAVHETWKYPTISRLRYYPSDAGDYRIPDYRQQSNISSAGFLLAIVPRKLEDRKIRLSRTGLAC
jgi:hypothetical protein